VSVAASVVACGGANPAGGGGATRSVSAMPSVAVGSAYPMSFVIVYQVSRNGVHQWEAVSVQRPFSASDLVYTTLAEPRKGDRAMSGSISTTTDLYAVDSQAVRLVTGRQPGPPSGDEYVGAEVTELTRRGLVVDLGASATVAGRACETYRFSAPPSGPIAPATRDGDHDDLCLDADGLVLSEVWTYHGKVVLQRTAVNATSSMTTVAQGAAPAAPPTEGAFPPGSYAATITPDAQVRSFIATPPPPAGFQPAGPAVDFRLPDRNARAHAGAVSVVWTFTDGPRVITVEAGSESRGGLPWRDGDTVTEKVTLTGLGPASTAARSDGFEIRVDLGGGHWVRVRGTVGLDQLVTYGHRLTPASMGPTGG